MKQWDSVVTHTARSALSSSWGRACLVRVESTRVLPFWVIVHHVHTVSREAAMTWPTRRALLCHVDCGRRERVSAGESDGRCRSRKVWVHTDRVRRGCVQDVAVMTFGVRAKPKAHGWRVVVLSVAEA